MGYGRILYNKERINEMRYEKGENKRRNTMMIGLESTVQELKEE